MRQAKAANRPMNKRRKPKDQIMKRANRLYLLVIFFSFIVFARIILLQYIQSERWAAMADKVVFRREADRARRGDILAADGRILASSVPYYTIYMDTRSTGLADTTWAKGIDGLSRGLAYHLGGNTPEGWKAALNNARQRGERYYLVRRRVSYETLAQLKQLPIFRYGRFRGGLIPQPENRRIMPNGLLARRTIGYLTGDSLSTIVGIEGAFNSYLAGRDGMKVQQRLTGGAWIDVDNAENIHARPGYDIVTTIDLDLQDAAENALYRQLEKHRAHHGCAVVMEVKSGDVKAIANLELGSDGSYHETYNYALGESTEPGSTFKLMTMIAALEDGVVDLHDTINTGDGTVRYYDKVIRDHEEKGLGKITVREVFEHSSNVGTAKIVNENYGSNPRKFIDRLYSMKINKPLGLQIRGEGQPVVRGPDDKLWSGISLPMMSHGYEVQMTPLQILTFYNAVANGGRMVKPRFVTEVRDGNRVVKSFDTEVVTNAICSRATIRKAQSLLEGVVENGTAKNLRSANYRIAGKTGTAQIANPGKGYRSGPRISYQASFVGYFPADNPVYSCIVVVNSPSNWVYYGNVVAGPVFREIADKAYAGSYYRDLQALNPDNNEKVTMREATAGLKNEGLTLTGGVMPDVVGMGLRDAVYLLENSGLTVHYSGHGRVVRQSPKAGAKISKGAAANIELRLR